MKDDSDLFIEWIKESIQFGLECLDVSTGEMLALIQFKSGEKNSVTVQADGEEDLSSDERIQLGHQLVAQFDDAEYYALLWSGAIMAGGKPQPVIAIETGSRSGSGSFITQPYSITADDRLEKAGPPQVAAGGVESVLGLQEGIARSVGESQEAPKKARSIGRRYDPITTLGDLAERAIHFAMHRMQRGNEAPFLALVDAETGKGRVTTATGRDDYGVAIEQLREQVLNAEDASMYAIVFFGMIEVKGKDVDAALAETGDRNGSAPTYCLTFKVSKSQNLTIGKEIKIISELKNLWGTAT